MDKDKLLKICNQTAENNFRCYSKGINDGPYLVYPNYREKEKGMRISEQETRTLMTHILEKEKVYYSIETPTKETYYFSGAKAMSAQTDLTIYDESKNNLANVEFKAHNPVSKAIEKDIEKLFREDVLGVWYHTLKNNNSGTIPALFKKFTNGILKTKDKMRNKHGILFYILILEKTEIIYRYFSSKELMEVSEESFEDLNKWKKDSYRVN